MRQPCTRTNTGTGGDRGIGVDLWEIVVPPLATVARHADSLLRSAKPAHSATHPQENTGSGQSACLNPIGAGDTVSGVMLCALVEGAAPTLAFARGIAAASVRCVACVSNFPASHVL